MAGETILIVEDVPEILRLSAGILRGAGYKVQIASTAEQALSTLRTLVPQLILVDFLLPGMHGLELTARVKQDARLRNTVIVALTGCATPADEEKARVAGCDGYLTKPIDARTLAARIRQYLDHEGEAPSSAAPFAAPAAPQAPADNPIAGLPAEELEELRDSFLTAGKGLSRQLLASLDGEFDEARARRTLHRWAGTGGLLGFPAISSRARDVEAILRTPPWTVARLRGPVTNLARAFHNPAGGSETTPPMARELAGKSIALIGLSEEDAERMCGALEQAGARPRLFAAEESPWLDAVANCSVWLVDVRPGTTGSQWLAPHTGPLPAVPTIFIGEPEHLLSLDREVQARACGLLLDGWLPEEALMRLRIAVSHVPPGFHFPASAGAGELVIAVGDESARALVQSRLERNGVACRMAANGPDTLLLLRHLRPPAAVLDAHMDGFEVLAAIRAESMPVRTLLLTAQQQDHEILRAISLGAGDYLVQPFSAVELLVRLKRLLA
jgi:DNA-binding response OmpR family regulator